VQGGGGHSIAPLSNTTAPCKTLTPYALATAPFARAHISRARG
jgi:hypothetical protein